VAAQQASPSAAASKASRKTVRNPGIRITVFDQEQLFRACAGHANAASHSPA
jgi:hypothetical protein